MKTRIYKYFSLIVASLILASCGKDFLEKLPSDSVSDDQIFSSVEAAQTALNSAHRQVGDYTVHTLAYILSDVMGEDETMTDGSAGKPTYNWNVFSYSYSQVPSAEPWWSGYANYIWPGHYSVVDHTNSIIKFVPELPQSEARDQLIARAYGLRGYAFLQLVRLFAPAYSLNKADKGIVLRLEPANATSEYIKRSTIEDAYKQIISDLTYAQEHITTTEADYITAKSAALLLARAYLDMQDYKNAKKYAEFAAGNTFDGSNLMSKEEWAAGFKDHNSEWLWYQNTTSTTSNIYASLPSFYYHAKSYKGYPYGGKVEIDDMMDDSKAVEMWDGYGTVRFTKAFVDMFEKTDVRKLFPFYFKEEDGFFTSKFGHRTQVGDADFAMLRIAEAYLIKAECEVHLGGNAADALNALQLKRGATATTATLENIYKERRKELYGEGHRIHDIKRLHQPLVRSIHKEHWAKIDLPADSPRFMLPIPENELLHNKAMTKDDQNAYWK